MRARIVTSLNDGRLLRFIFVFLYYSSTPIRLKRRPHRHERSGKYALNLNRRPGSGLALASFDPYHSLSTAFIPMLALLRRVPSFRMGPVRAFSTTRSNAAPSNSIQELADLVEETQSRLEEEVEHQVQRFSPGT